MASLKGKYPNSRPLPNIYSADQQKDKKNRAKENFFVWWPSVLDSPFPLLLFLFTSPSSRRFFPFPLFSPLFVDMDILLPGPSRSSRLVLGRGAAVTASLRWRGPMSTCKFAFSPSFHLLPIKINPARRKKIANERNVKSLYFRYVVISSKKRWPKQGKFTDGIFASDILLGNGHSCPSNGKMIPRISSYINAIQM